MEERDKLLRTEGIRNFTTARNFIRNCLETNSNRYYRQSKTRGIRPKHILLLVLTTAFSFIFSINHTYAQCTYEVYDSESFESAPSAGLFGIWNNGGVDCDRVTTHPNTGSYSLRLRDNSSTSVLTTKDLDLIAYEKIRVDFSYYAVSMENNEDFWLQYSTDDGSNYTTVADYDSGDEFNNDERHNVQVEINGPFTVKTRIRFRVDASDDDDQVFFDDVVINGCLPNGPEICDNNIDDDGDGDIDCNDSDCNTSGNADIVVSQSGITNSIFALGASDTQAAEFYENADQMVLDLTDVIFSGADYTIRWRKDPGSGGTPTVTVEESANGSSWSDAAGSPYSPNDTSYFDETITASTSTRYLRIINTSPIGWDMQLDAASYSVPCLQAEICNNNIDDDGDGDIDCADSDCGPTITCGASIESGSYHVYNSEGFESAWLGDRWYFETEIWIDGGVDCQLDSDYANTGSYAVNLQDDHSSSVLTTNDLDLTEYEELRIDFSYIVRSYETAEDFWLQISTDGGSSYTTVEEWNLGDEFNNLERHNESVTISGPFTVNTRIRFRSNASNNGDDVYLDDIVINVWVPAQTTDPGSCTAAVTFPGPATEDNCGLASVVNDFNGTANASDTYPAGTTTVIWTVTDLSGNTNNCSQDITVTDDEDPTITCAAGQTQTADAAACTAAVTVTGPATGDNCGVATIVNDFNGTANASDTYPVGTTTVIWTVTDVLGNTDTCSQDITVTDDEDPTITCAADQTQTADADSCNAVVTVVGPATGDNCGVATIVNDFNGTANASDTYPVGTTAVIWTVTDLSGNTNTCSQDITVTDDEDPTITCAADQTQTADAAACTAAVTVTGPATGDNCGVATVVNDFNGTANASDTYPVGTTTVTWIATDGNSNTNTCSQDITVTDDEDPTITCAADQTTTADSATCNAAVTVVDPAVSDNCGLATPAVINDFNGTANASGTYPVGTTTVIWTVTDVNGKTNNCSQDITVTGYETCCTMGTIDTYPYYEDWESGLGQWGSSPRQIALIGPS